VAGDVSAAARREVEAARDTLESIGDAVLSTDLSGRVTYLNLAAESMTGWSRAEAAGRPLADVLHIVTRGTRERARDPLSLAVALDKTVGLTADCILVRRDGSETEIEDSASPIHSRDGHVTGAVMVFRDVGAALDIARQMAHEARHDGLTGLPNRQWLAGRLTEAIAFAERRGKPLGVAFLDIDGFKSLNDTLGHAAGDQLLQAVATRLADALRRSDTVSRYGGDEFVVVLPEIEHATHAATVGNKLRDAAAGSYRVGSRDVFVTASLGLSLYPEDGHDAGTLIAKADAAMYEAKRAGSGNVRLAERSG
jgi:diguanylate cyclase (GGDEF)-like protein/PAS domain S-box-containing protein